MDMFAKTTRKGLATLYFCADSPFLVVLPSYGIHPHIDDRIVRISGSDILGPDAFGIFHREA